MERGEHRHAERCARTYVAGAHARGSVSTATRVPSQAAARASHGHPLRGPLSPCHIHPDETETVEPQSPWPGEDSGSDRTGSRSGRSGGSGSASGGGSGDGGAARAVLGTLCTAGCRGASGRSDGGGTSRFTVSGTALARVLARAFGGVDSGGARARSARTAPLHTTVDAGAPPAAGAVPGLMRRRARVGGCSEAWRELYVRLDTKSAPWSDDNGPHLVFGWRWSEGVLPHHPERTTGRSVPVGSGHHCEAAPKGTYAALISRPRAVCRARTAPTTAAKRVRKLNEGSLLSQKKDVKMTKLGEREL